MSDCPPGCRVNLNIFCKRAQKYGYLLNFTPIKDIVRVRDNLLWKQITKECDHCLRDLYFPCRGEGCSVLAAITTFYLVFVWNVLTELLLTDVFLVLFRLQLVFSFVMNICRPCTLVCRHMLLCN